MVAPIYYIWDRETKIYENYIEAQIDQLETELAGYEIYCGAPQNATELEPLEPKEGFNVVWNGTAWEYQEIPTPPPAPEPTEEEKKERVREVRNAYLASTDFTQLDDAPFTEEEKISYQHYRQYLRDYTQTEDWWEQNPKTYEEWIEL